MESKDLKDDSPNPDSEVELSHHNIEQATDFLESQAKLLNIHVTRKEISDWLEKKKVLIEDRLRKSERLSRSSEDEIKVEASAFESDADAQDEDGKLEDKDSERKLSRSVVTRHADMDMGKTQVKITLLKLWLAESGRDQELSQKSGERLGFLRSQTLQELGTITEFTPEQPKPPSNWLDRIGITNYIVLKLPIKKWLPECTRDTIKSDFIAGLETALNIVPKSLAYAMLADIPLDIGLYSAIFPAFIYTILGTSKHLGVGPSALVCLLTGAVAKSWCARDGFYPLGHPLAPEESYSGNCDEAEYVYIVRKMAFVQGWIMFGLGFLRGGFIIRFFSRPLMTGFLTGSTLIICATQTKYLLYNDSVHIEDSKALIDQLRDTIDEISNVHGWTILFSAIYAVLIYLLKRWHRTSQLYSLIIVIASTVVTYIIATYSDIDLYITGHISGGFPTPDDGMINTPHPETDSYDSIPISDWVYTALAVGLVGFLESSAAAQIFALKYGYSIDINQEMVAVGVGNIVGSAFHVMPTMGSLGTTAMLATFGCKTGLANFFLALVALLCTLFATELFKYLPKCALALIVMSAVLGLIDIPEMIFLYKAHLRDFYIVLIGIAITCAFGIDFGMEAAILLNMISFVYRCTNMESFEIGREPGSNEFRPIIPHEDQSAVFYTYDGVVILHLNGALFFGNCTSFKERLFAYLNTPSRISKGLVVDARSITFIDASGAHVLEEVVTEYRERGFLIVFVGFNSKIRKKLEQGNIMPRAISNEQLYHSFEQALRDVLEQKIMPVPLPQLPPDSAGAHEILIEDEPDGDDRDSDEKQGGRRRRQSKAKEKESLQVRLQRWRAQRAASVKDKRFSLTDEVGSPFQTHSLLRNLHDQEQQLAAADDDDVHRALLQPKAGVDQAGSINSGLGYQSAGPSIDFPGNVAYGSTEEQVSEAPDRQPSSSWWCCPRARSDSEDSASREVRQSLLDHKEEDL